MQNQLLLFQDSPDEIQERKMKSLEEKYINLTKSLHARIGELKKKNSDLECRLERIESGICKGSLFV